MVAGASCRLAPDWDIPISLIMPALTYLTTSWSIRVLTGRRWTLWPLALFATWFTVDGVYWLDWHLVDPAALDAMRGSNWPASLPLYFFCGRRLGVARSHRVAPVPPPSIRPASDAPTPAVTPSPATGTVPVGK